MLFSEALRPDWQQAMTALLCGTAADRAARTLAECAMRATAASGAAFSARSPDGAVQRVCAAVGVLAPWQGFADVVPRTPATVEAPVPGLRSVHTAVFPVPLLTEWRNPGGGDPAGHGRIWPDEREGG